jgi:hypothetical protein
MPETRQQQEGQQQPGDERPPPESAAELFKYIMDRNGYRHLHELSNHTSIPYKTLWSWQDGSRSAKRPPSVTVLRNFAKEMGTPEAIVFRAMGRAYNEPGALDDESIDLINQFKLLPEGDARRLLRIVILYREMTPEQRAITESVVRGVATADQPKLPVS